MRDFWNRATLLVFILFSQLTFAKVLPAVTEVVPIKDINDYAQYSPEVKELIQEAYILSQKKLTYLYGSSDPKNGGMDCSGTIYFLLNKARVIDPPRSSDEMFNWTEKQGHLYRTHSNDFSSSEFAKLKAGDLLFWSGTYKTSNAISHVMIYLGKNSNGKPLMFGSSDGRTYQGKKMWGVSVFDFNLPDEKTNTKFVGYSCIPNLTC